MSSPQRHRDTEENLSNKAIESTEETESTEKRLKLVAPGLGDRVVRGSERLLLRQNSFGCFPLRLCAFAGNLKVFADFETVWPKKSVSRKAPVQMFGIESIRGLALVPTQESRFSTLRDETFAAEVRP